MAATRCNLTKPDGSPCRMFALKDGSGRCLQHSETEFAVNARNAARYKNREPRFQPLDIGPCSTAEEVCAALSLIARTVMLGRCDKQSAQVASNSLRTQLAALTLAEELAEAKRQIASLRKRLGVTDGE